MQNYIPKLQKIRNKYLSPLQELAEQRKRRLQMVSKLEARKGVVSSYRNIIDSMTVPPSNGILWMCVVLEVVDTPEECVQKYTRAQESIAQLLTLWDGLAPVVLTRLSTEELIAHDVESLKMQFDGEPIPAELAQHALQERYEDKLEYWKKNRKEWDLLVEETVKEVGGTNGLQNIVDTLESIKNETKLLQDIEKQVTKIKVKSYKDHI